MKSRVQQAELNGNSLSQDGRGLMNRRAFINKLGVVAGGVALSVSWASTGVAKDSHNPDVSSGTSRDVTASFDDPTFGMPGYADDIPFPKPVTNHVALAMDDPLFNIFSV